MSDETTDPLAEVKAMQKLAEAVGALDQEAVSRVLRWAVARYGVTTEPVRNVKGHTGSTPADGGNGNGGAPRQFDSLADLYAVASPETDSDKALVAGYWFQFQENQPDFAAQAINAALKNLGHGVSNITNAFNALKAQKPALVIQLKKAGTTKQARKTYKLTAAGKTAVELLIGQH
jgi:hypothetical protein